MADRNPKEQIPRAVVIMDLFSELGESFFDHEGLEGCFHIDDKLSCRHELMIWADSKQILHIIQWRIVLPESTPLYKYCGGWLLPRTKVYDEAYSDQLDAYIEALPKAIADRAAWEDRARKDAEAVRVFEETRF